MAENLPFLYYGTIIHTHSLKELEIIENGVIVIHGKKIVYISKDPDLEKIKKEFGVVKENVFVLDRRQFLIPGFIDTHTHAPQYPNSGIGYELTLLDWLDTYTFKLEKRFSDNDFAAYIYDAVVKRTLSNGTTTSCYFATIHNESTLTLANCAAKYGQRAFIGKVNMVKNCPEDYCEGLQESLDNTEAFIREIKAIKNHLITPIITPRFAITSTMELMKGLADLAAKHNLPIQTHVSENKDEIRRVAEQYPNSKNYVDVYDSAGLVTDKTILAHGVHLDPDEINTLRERKATISHCAHSNIMLQSGLCPVRRLLNSGVKIALGTDCSGGASSSMLNAIRRTIMSSIHAQFNGWGNRLAYGEVFYLATLAGAEALSIGNVTGNFKVGKEFDALLINLKDNPSIDLLMEYTAEELFQIFINLGDDRMIAKVYVSGREVTSSFKDSNH